MPNIADETTNSSVYFRVVKSASKLLLLQEEKVPSLSKPNLVEPKFVSRALTSFSEKYSHISTKGGLLKSSQNQRHPLIQNQTRQLAVRGCLRKHLLEDGILQTLLFHQGQRVLDRLTHRPRISGLADFLNKTLIWFDVMRTRSWIS